MKQHFTLAILLQLFVLPFFVKGQISLPNQGDHQVCQFSSEPYGVEKIGSNTYLWSVISLDGANGIIKNASSNLISIYWEKAGTCLLQLVETNEFGCSNTVSIKVTINPTPVLIINNPGASCSVVDLTLQTIIAGSQLPQGNVLTYWTDEAATLELSNPKSVNVSGTYYIKALSNGGCYDIMPVTVTINPAQAPTITGTDIACYGNTELYGVPFNASNTYSWTVTGGSIETGQNSNEVSVKWTGPTGLISITETSSNCTSNASKDVIINPLPTTLTIFHN